MCQTGAPFCPVRPIVEQAVVDLARRSRTVGDDRPATGPVEARVEPSVIRRPPLDAAVLVPLEPGPTRLLPERKTAVVET